MEISVSNKLSSKALRYCEWFELPGILLLSIRRINDSSTAGNDPILLQVIEVDKPS